MRCPFCGHIEDKVVDSRESRKVTPSAGGASASSAGAGSHYERLRVPILIVKKDGRREPFDYQSCCAASCPPARSGPCPWAGWKRPPGYPRQAHESPDREVPSRQLGELVMDALKQIDSVAYVRFASVYRDFKDLPDFVRALESLMRPPRPGLRLSLPPSPVAQGDPGSRHAGGGRGSGAPQPTRDTAAPGRPAPPPPDLARESVAAPAATQPPARRGGRRARRHPRAGRAGRGPFQVADPQPFKPTPLFPAWLPKDRSRPSDASPVDAHRARLLARGNRGRRNRHSAAA